MTTSAAIQGPPLWPTFPLAAGRVAHSSVAALAAAINQALDHRGISARCTGTTAAILAAFTAVERTAKVQRHPVFADMSGFFRCRDGWVRTHANYEHHRQAIASITGATCARELTDALAGESALDVESAIVGAGGVAGAMRSAEQWRQTPAGAAVAASPLVSIDTDGVERPPLSQSSTSILAGVRVVDFTRVVAGPVATSALAALGADVVRINPPQLPEDPLLTTALGGGKHALTLDLRTDKGAAEARALVADADVAVLGYRPGALARLGLDHQTLRALHPQLVIGVISAWGLDGPWATRRGFDSVVQSVTGIAARSADRTTGRPGALPAQVLDHSAGFQVAAGIVSMLGDEWPRGGVVSTSLARMSREVMDLSVVPGQGGGDQLQPEGPTTWSLPLNIPGGV